MFGDRYSQMSILLVGVWLTLFLTEASWDVKTVKAYDCSAPENIHDVNLQNLNCAAQESKVRSYRNTTVQILQKREKSKTEGYKCMVRYHQRMYYCGWYPVHHFNVDDGISIVSNSSYKIVSGYGLTHLYIRNFKRLIYMERKFRRLFRLGLKDAQFCIRGLKMKKVLPKWGLFNCFTVSDFLAGVFDHITPFTPYDLLYAQEHISTTECRELVDSMEYTDPSGQKTKLVMNGEAYVRYFKQGAFYIQSGEVKCVGQALMINDEPVERMVISIQKSVSISEEIIEGDSSMVTSVLTDHNLPCGIQDLGCRTTHGTFVWDAVHNRCPELKVAKTVVSGMMVEGTNGESIFISTDNSLLRLPIESTVGICGRKLLSTSYSNFFVYEVEEFSAEPFLQEVEPEDVDIISFVKNRDDFLYNHIREQLEDEFAHTSQMICKERLKTARMEFFLQLQLPSLTNYYLGNGTFATSAGEVLHTYTCKELLVKTRDTTQCFDVLPVESIGSDENGNLWHIGFRDFGKGNKLNLSEPGTEWFIEPLTHRLTQVGIVQDCSLVFPAKYKNVHGDWITADPKVSLAKSPGSAVDLTSLQNGQKSLQVFDDVDWSQGGLYDEKILKQVNLNFQRRRMVENLAFKLEGHSDPSIQYSSVPLNNPSQLFPQVKIPWTAGFWSWISDSYFKLGLFCSIATVTYWIYSSIGAIKEMILRMWVVRGLYQGFFNRIMRAICLDTLMAMDFRRRNRPKDTDIEGQNKESEMQPLRTNNEPGVNESRNVNENVANPYPNIREFNVNLNQ